MFAFAIFAMAIPAAGAQESAVKSNSPESPVPSTKQSKPKPTPEQEAGIHLLGEAQAEAPKLQRDMHAFVLWQISKSYAKVDRTKSQDFLYQGFLATLSLEYDPENCIVNSDCWVKGWLQQNILYQMLEDSPDEVEELLVRAKPTARTGITDALVQHNISKKNFSHAKDLLAQNCRPAQLSLWYGHKINPRFAQRAVRRLPGNLQPGTGQFQSIWFRGEYGGPGYGLFGFADCQVGAAFFGA
jgi:hypothetical protein